MRRTAFLVGLLGLAACVAPQAEQSFGPDGRVAYAIKCGGQALAWADCYRKAGEICRQAGYDILGAREEPAMNFTSTIYGTVANTSQNRSLVISCRNG